ncbi:MAG TPA: glycine zipper domain-containing protein [Rhizomicrobium sp.]
MLGRTARLLAVAALSLCAGTTGALADACSGHGHTTGTVLGAVGGGAIGSAVSHGSLGGVLGGAVLGGLAGNAVSRDMDCRHGHYYRHARYRHAHYYWRHGHRYPR